MNHLIAFTCLLVLLPLCCGQQMHQYFAEQPANTSVREGQMAVLRCRVGNRQGRVQWTKDGFALGFSRTIPSFPRYTIMGTDELGEHHMKIENATLDDDAEYQCQVGPSGSVKPIRANARLTVLIPPSEVEIVDHVPGGRVRGREGEEIVIQCVVRGAKPAAEIVWYKRNVEFKSGLIENSTSDSELPRRFDTRSKLTIQARPDDHDAEYTCEARHPALSSPKRASVSLNVEYPPGPPEIIGYSDGETVLMGQDVRLECVSRGGNPLATIVWYKNNVKVDQTFETAGRESRNVYAFRAEASDNNARFRCEVGNDLTVATMKAEVKLIVRFQPQNVSVRVRPGKLRPGVTATLSCETSSSNPESRVTWIRGKSGHVIPATANSTASGQHLGFVTNSSLQLAVTPDLHGAEITCQASNGIGSTIHDVVTLEVLYKPEFVHPPEHTINVIEGEPATINLTARANPSAVTYKWSRSANGIKSSTDSSQYERVTSNGSLLSITRVQREDNGEYKCEAENSEGKTVTTVRLNVQYAASIVHIKQVVMVDEGSDAVLECQAAGNPLTASTVAWRRDGFDMQGRTVLSSIQNGTAYLSVKDVARNDTGAFECVASNGIGSEIVEKTWLVVKYKPVMDDAPHLSKAAGDEGETARLVCRAQGAPNITFSWSREGNPITPSSPKYSLNTRQLDLMTWESTLDINSVVSKDYGLYDCVARNEKGTNVMRVALSGTSRPDTPIALHVINATHDAVQLAWIPGFDGGIAQGFRLRYSQIGSELVKYADVYPRNVTSFTLGGLALGTEYKFSVMALNDRGESNYTQDIVKARTSSLDPANEEPADSPSLARSDWTTIIIAVSTVGFVLLLIVNIVIVSCLCVRRRKKRIEEAMSSEGGSSKSATIEMYAPSSYNETVNGETLSSISEKSEAYSQNGSHSDYAAEDASKAAVSTYLIDQPDGQVAYGSYRVAANNPGQVSAHGTLSRPPKTVNFDMGEDNYIDTLRRNAYTQGNDAMYGKPRMATPLSQHPDSYYGVNASSPINYPPAPPPGFHSNVNHRFNPLNDPVSSQPGTHSPYTPMGTLNIPAASGIYGPSASGRVSAGLPVNLPLPLPMSMQAHHGTQFSSFSPSDAPSPVMETATAQFSGPSLATVRSLETEGHLV